MRKDVRTILSVALAIFAVTACGDDPLAEDRDEAVFIFTNPSFATITADTVGVKVRANIMNKYNAPTGDAVTATPCSDGGLTVAVDPLRTEFEAPERFIVKGVKAGPSCLVVSGGGISDTVGFFVGPTTVSITTAATLGSGETSAVTIAALNGIGQPLEGFSASDLVVTSSNSSVVFVDTLNGNQLQGRAPGTATITVTNRAGTGATKTATATVTVSAGTFTGTVNPTSANAGQLVTVTAGAVPFDADTRVTVGGETPSIFLPVTATTLQFVLPFGMTGSKELVINNMGPNQISSKATITTANTSAYIDAQAATAEAAAGNDNSLATARNGAIPSVVYGVSSSADADDYIKFTLATSGIVTINLNWFTAADIDLALYNSAGASQALTPSCASSRQPEVCVSGTLAAGTYYARVNWYDGVSTPYVLTLTRN